MKVDIAKAVKNIKGTIDFYRPLYEAIVNAFQANANNLSILFDIEKKEHTDYIAGYAIIDDGDGYNDDNIDSFLTLWSTHNEDKGALGSGRIICLKVFNNILIESNLKHSNTQVNIDFNKKFQFNDVSEISKKIIEYSSERNQTTTRYTNITDEYLEEKHIYNKHEITKKIFIELLPLFIEFNDTKKNFSIGINNELWINKDSLHEEFKKLNFTKSNFSLNSSLKDDKRQFDFTLTYNISHDGKNQISQFYGASGRKVIDFPTNSRVKRLPENGSAIFCLTSKYLDNLVSDSRENFLFGFNDNNPHPEYPLLFRDINKKLEDVINKLLRVEYPDIDLNLNEEKNKALEEYPYLSHYIKNIDKLTISKTDIVKIAEKEFDKRFKETKKEVIQFTQNILKTKNLTKSKYLEITKSFTEVGQEQLAHYIAYRQTIIEMLFNVHECNMDKNKESFSEDYIHELIMPHKKIKFNHKHIITENNFWLFDDKFMSYSYSASDTEIDKIISSLSLEMNDETMEYFGKDRPDLLMLYSNDISELKDVILIELKKINISSYDRSKAIDQLNIYASVIRDNIPDVNDIFVYSVFEFDHKLEKILLNRGFHPKAFSKDNHNLTSFYMYNPNNHAHVHALSFYHLISDASLRNKLFLDILRNEIASEEE